MYSSEIAPTPIHTHASFPCEFSFERLKSSALIKYTLDVVFHGRWRRLAVRPDSFAEQQAKLAHIAVSQLLESGEHIVSTLQGNLVYISLQCRMTDLRDHSTNTAQLVLRIASKVV